MERLMEYITDCQGFESADATLAGLTKQDGYRGGRLVPLGNRFRVQVYFDAPTVQENMRLPDGCRMVRVPSCLLQHLEIKERK